MKISKRLNNLSIKLQISKSPSQFLFLSSPLMFVVIGILIAAFQINLQLYSQQEAIIGRLAHAAVRHTAQLQREHLRLVALIAGTRSTLDDVAFQSQLELLESRIHVMEITVLSSDPPQKVYVLYDDYVAGWQALQPSIAAWRNDPADDMLRGYILDEMKRIEVDANGILILAQSSFEDHMSGWAAKSQFLNRLLTMGVMSFGIIVLLIFYTAYLFIKGQAASEDRLRAILDAVPDAVYRVNRSGFYTDYKPAINGHQHGAKDLIVGRSLKDILPADTAAMVHEAIDKVLKTGEQLILDLPLPDTEMAEIHHYEARLLPSGTDEVQIVARDVTLERKKEEASLQAQKLESLGVLAGGIAHDFNNLLTGMLGQASLAIAKIDRGLPPLENIKKVVLSAERATDLTRQLLAYTGKGKFQVGPLNINGLIRDTAGMLNTTLPSYASLHLNLQGDLPQVQADRGQIQQVIMNLFINAIEALPEGRGSIEIITTTQQVHDASAQGILSEGNATGDSLAPGLYVVIKVADTGTGMDRATLRRIFDPFFTTKPKGHGLGLSATIGIMRTHGGLLQAQSELGVGTTFTLLLPALVEDVVAVEDQPLLTNEASTEVREVLIIDDEEQVRETAGSILKLDGCSIRCAASGSKGVEIFRNHNTSVDLVLLDLQMPGMNGKETYQELRKIEPDVKVIFTSGYSEAEITSIVKTTDRVTFLPKPYTTDSLVQHVRRMLAMST